MLRRIVLLWLALALAMAPAAAQTFPKFTGFVVDDANVLDPETEAALTAKLDSLQRDTKRQLVVATIADLQGYPLADYGYRLGRAWGVGLKEADNGAILFIAPNEPTGQRGPRLEVGYGLEPILTDAFASSVTMGQMSPMLRAGDIQGAMIAGTDSIIAQLRASPEEAQAKVDAAVAEFDARNKTSGRSSSGGEGFPASLIFWGIVLLFVVLPLFGAGKRGRGRRYRGRGGDGGLLPVMLWSIASDVARGAGGDGGGGGWGGGWGGGGFSGGGGGSFGGGGASGGW